MDFYNLPTDTLINILLPLSAVEIESYCQSNKNIRATCQSNNFYTEMLIRKYRLKINNIPGLTLKEKYNYVSQLMLKVETANIFTMGMTLGYSINKEFQNILVQAVKIGDEDFLESIITTLFSRIEKRDKRIYNSPDYAISFREAFIESLQLGNIDIISILRIYYTPEDDDDFYDLLIRPAILNGDLKYIKRLMSHGYFGTTAYEFAVNNDKYDIADYIRISLIMRDQDPLTELDFVDELYVEALSKENVKRLEYLVNIVQPDIEFLYEVGTDIISEKMLNLLVQLRNERYHDA